VTDTFSFFKRAFNAAAASQGCMNNLSFGDDSFGYYEVCLCWPGNNTEKMEITRP